MREFDYSNMFTNFDLVKPTSKMAVVSEIFKQKLNIVTETAALESGVLCRSAPSVDSPHHGRWKVTTWHLLQRK